MVEGVGNTAYIFNRRPIVFKKLIMFLRGFFKIVSSCCSLYKTFFLVWLSFVYSVKMCFFEYWLADN